MSRELQVLAGSAVQRGSDGVDVGLASGPEVKPFREVLTALTENSPDLLEQPWRHSANVIKPAIA
jgi:hypothetical protein